MRSLCRHRFLRLTATTLAFIAIAGQVSSFAHLVLVRHVTCAEHGELIELGHEQAITTPAPRQEAVAAVSASSTADAHGHDHCLLAPMRRDRAALGTPTSLDSRHVDAYGTIGPVFSGDLPPTIAIILLAPKNSPPLV